jgi:hypothetical protein
VSYCIISARTRPLKLHYRDEANAIVIRSLEATTIEDARKEARKIVGPKVKIVVPSRGDPIPKVRG